jgi:hypothetical protein
MVARYEASAMALTKGTERKENNELKQGREDSSEKVEWYAANLIKYEWY